MTNHDRIFAAAEAKRKELGMTKEQFAEVKLGLRKTHYSNLKRARKKFSVRLLAQLYRLGVSPDLLFGVDK